mgnify:FL=1
MIDVRSFTKDVTEAFKSRYAEHFDGNEDADFTEGLVRMMALVAALAIEKYERENQR